MFNKGGRKGRNRQSAIECINLYGDIVAWHDESLSSLEFFSVFFYLVNPVYLFSCYNVFVFCWQ